MRIVHSALIALSCLATLPAIAQAHEVKAGDLVIEHPWSRATTGQNGAAFMVIENHGKEAEKLTAVTSPVSADPMMHASYQDGDVMKMRMVEAIEIPAGGKTELKPGSYHIMLMGLKAPLKEGQMIPVTLTFQKAGKVELEVMVEAAGAAAPNH